MKLRENLLIGVIIAIFTFFIWAWINRPETEPVWPEKVQGLCLSPMQAGQNPLIGRYPSIAQINADLSFLAGKTRTVRTYTVEHTIGEVAKLAQSHGLKVVLGAWIDADKTKTEKEIQTLIRITRTNKNVEQVIVGNEAVLRGDIPLKQMIAYLDRVRTALEVPVSTAEPWHVWIKHPELVKHVDFLAVHMLPYWEGIHVDQAVDYIVQHVNGLRALFPDKPIVIAEVGWPSNGRTRRNAKASTANEAVFLRRFLERAQKEHYHYYLMEAFDQPWKHATEGAVGAYWGVWDVHRHAKFPFTDPIVPIPNWHLLAGASVLVAGIMLTLLLIDSQSLRRQGRSFLAIVAYSSATAAVWIVYDYSHRYLTFGTVLVGILMFAGMIGVIIMVLSEAHEWAEARWVNGRRRPFKTLSVPDDALPMVSIHVPVYNEPPQMLMATLDALNRLDYPRFEVLVVDNNTKNPMNWQPIARHCNKLGSRFKFFHVDPLSGFKAGALNFTLKHTCRQAKIVAVVDSDYLVHSSWLKDLVPQFNDARIGLVQAPQDYRDQQANAFKAICHSEYRGFFHIGMVTRNERNAIIQHGTMTLVRRKVLEAVGGWAEWCITEDAELGLRIFTHGYEALYVPQSYGQGLMPDTFGDYQRQRFRWAYGAIQILRHNAGRLFGRMPECLSKGQRYHYLVGWLPWISDGVNLLFGLAALAWSLAMIIAPERVDPPLVALSLLPLVLFTFKVVKLIYLYRTRIKATLAQTVYATLAGLSLSYTIAKAVLLGFVTDNKPFIRTPKMAHKLALVQAMTTAYQEIIVLVAFLAAVVGIVLRQPLAYPDVQLWILVLVVQAIPYLASVLMSAISGIPPKR